MAGMVEEEEGGEAAEVEMGSGATIHEAFESFVVEAEEMTRVTNPPEFMLCLAAPLTLRSSNRESTSCWFCNGASSPLICCRGVLPLQFQRVPFLRCAGDCCTRAARPWPRGR